MVINAGQIGHLKRHGQELHLLPTQECSSFSYFCIFTNAEIHKVFWTWGYNTWNYERFLICFSEPDLEDFLHNLYNQSSGSGTGAGQGYSDQGRNRRKGKRKKWLELSWPQQEVI